MARILIGNIKGPKGDTGPQGKQGPTGPQGPKGDTGPMPALINNAATTSAGVGALDAAMGKTLSDQIAVLNSDLDNGKAAYNGLEIIYDANTTLQPGIYVCNETENTPGAYGFLTVKSAYNGSWIIQEFYGIATGESPNIYKRSYVNSTWSDGWEQTTGYVPFAVGLPSNQKFYMALVPGDENRIYFYSGENPTSEYSIGYIVLTP